MASALLAGWIVVHAAFPAVLDTFPERADPAVAGYVAVTDCAMMGQRLVLVRPGLPDVLLAVADCAWPAHAQYREERGYIADVDEALWFGAWIPQRAELWLPAARAAYLAEIVPAQLGPAYAM
jgi:hypothetical protein